MSDTRWLTSDEQLAWRAFLFATLLVSTELDHQLRHDSHMSHDYYGMLSRLSEAPNRSLRMSDLAQLTSSSASRLSHAVANLEKLGWIIRRRSATDRRVHFAVLTDVGMQALVDAAPGHIEAVRQYLLDSLTPEQQAQLTELLGTIVRHLNKDLAESAGLVPVDPDLA